MLYVVSVSRKSRLNHEQLTFLNLDMERRNTMFNGKRRSQRLTDMCRSLIVALSRSERRQSPIPGGLKIRPNRRSETSQSPKRQRTLLTSSQWSRKHLIGTIILYPNTHFSLRHFCGREARVYVAHPKRLETRGISAPDEMKPIADLHLH